MLNIKGLFAIDRKTPRGIEQYSDSDDENTGIPGATKLPLTGPLAENEPDH